MVTHPARPAMAVGFGQRRTGAAFRPQTPVDRTVNHASGRDVLLDVRRMTVRLGR